MTTTTIDNIPEGSMPIRLIKQAGFTLIELSIVLVIIGLIVGGVLVGQDLIKAAEIRATISQYEKYNAAINTFRTKYNSIPGDMLVANVTAFGLSPATGTLVTGGDGNGLIESASTSNTNSPSGEPILFWQQLSTANLVDGSLGTAITTAGVLGASPTATLYLPAAKSGRGGYWIAGSSAGLNYFGLAGITALTGGTAGASTYTNTNALTPIEAFNIDTKMDDGLPYTGTVQARGVGSNTAGTDIFYPTLSSTVRALWTGVSEASTDCVTGNASNVSTANTYARNTGGNGVNCSLRMRFN